MLAAAGARGATDETIGRSARRVPHQPAPLSNAQQRLWFMHQLAPDSAFYNVPFATRLNGHVDIPALQRALDEIVLRHEVLRTSFPLVDGAPVQVVSDQAHVPLEIVDITAHPIATRRAEAQRLADEEATKPFELAIGPVIRAMAVKLEDAEHWLVMTLHHIVADGWSMNVLSQELGALYAAFSAGLRSPLPPLPLQYAEFATWQREWLKGEGLEVQMAYWAQQLANLPTVPLLTDRPRASTPDFRGGFHRFAVPDGVISALRDLAEDQNATLFMALLATFNVLLFRYTSQEDVVVGAPIANRSRKELEPLIGFFVNTLVLRTDLSGNPSFRTVIARTRRVALDAYDHQDVPFERLVEVLQPERDISRNPLFQIGFVLQNAWNASTSTGNEADRDREPDVQRGTSIFDLAIHLWERGEGIGGGIEYSTALFDETTIARLGVHFLTLLEGAVVHPDASIADLPLIRTSESHRVAVSWNRTQAPYPDDACFHQLIEAWAAKTPDAPALAWMNKVVTYEEINQRANVVARRLRGLGISTGSLVLLCMERSIEMVVGFLGITKAGAAYVPLDVNYPAERLRFVVEDTGARVLLSTDAFARTDAGAALKATGVAMLCLEEDLAPTPPMDNLDEAVGPDDLAYVIYTSGSTGQPKGVLITHRGLCNVVAAQRRVLGTGPDSRVLQFASLSFDASIFEIAMALGSGGTLHIPPPGLLPGPDLAAYLREEHVTIVTLTPTALAAMPYEPLAALATISVAGEPCPGTLVKRWSAGRRFCNLYGPTETTIWATYAECANSSEKPSIGRPIQNTRIYIMDSQCHPVPIGVPGEIWIGGVGLARGYLNRLELTAERFQTITIGDTVERAYRTGDRGRFLADGSIDFLGRLDHQVKFHGFRIELAEIEATLREHPSLRDAVAAMREDHPGDCRLVAYVTTAHDLTTADEPAARALAQEQVSHWHSIYEGLYAKAGDDADPAFNITGWNNSYTSAPIPPAEMREWLDETVARIRTLAPKRILEIGCGAGLLVFPLAPLTEMYTAADFSAAATAYVQQNLPHDLRMDDRVRLLTRNADDFSAIRPGEHDVVILNSVVQYFPSADYLRRVVTSAVRAVAPRGAVFIGDLRSLALLETFALSVELAQAEDDVTVAELRDRVARRLLIEHELIVAPEFFYALRQELPEIQSIEVLVKHGHFHNELSTYRYDVILHIGNVTSAVSPLVPRSWSAEVLTVEALRAELGRNEGTDLYVTGVPNARIQRDVRARMLLTGLDEKDLVGNLRSRLADQRDGIYPDKLAELGESLGFDVELYLADGPDTFDIVFRQRSDLTTGRRQLVLPGKRNLRTASHFTNNPLRGVFLRTMVPRIRSFLETRLPGPLLPSHYVLLEQLPRTVSGKVDRARLPRPDRARPDLGVEYVAPTVDIERRLARIWCEVLGIDKVGVFDNFFELGGDSILGIQIVAKARSMGLLLSPRHVLEQQTISALAGVCKEERPISAEQGIVTGPVPLTPIQRWFFELNLADPHHFNQAVMIRLAQPIALDELRESVRHVLRHHDALRLRFHRHNDTWQQTCEPFEGSVPVSHFDLSEEPPGGRAASLASLVAHAQASLDLAEGPLFRVLLIHLGDREPDRLFLVAHHLNVDAVSWRIIMEDIRTAYEQLVRGQNVLLPSKTTSFQRWAELLGDYAQSHEAQSELSYWRGIASEAFDVFPVDHNSGPNIMASVRTVTVTSKGETASALLTTLADRLKSNAEEILLSALVHAVADVTGKRNLLIDVERHGREDLFPEVDLSRTVGWFTSIVPTSFPISRDAKPKQILQSVKERLRGTPKRGFGFGVLCYLSWTADVSSIRQSLLEASVAFNYLGQLGGVGMGSAVELPLDVGPTRGESNVRRHAIEVNGYLANRQFTFDFHYSENLHKRSTVEQLAEKFIRSLEAFADLGRSGERTYAASDFKHARLNKEDFTKLMAQLKAKHKTDRP
jgi:amino acid adenylation domain-containing protein/non-ribosomal peptide synthase protein (TIGR01720 family)